MSVNYVHMIHYVHMIVYERSHTHTPFTRNTLSILYIVLVYKWFTCLDINNNVLTIEILTVTVVISSRCVYICMCMPMCE